VRVLIDECVDPRVKTLLLDHLAATVHDQGWGAFEDGALLAAAQDAFDVLVTIDRKLEFQQNVARFRIGLVVVRVTKNQLRYYQVIREELLWAIQRVQAGEVVHVDGVETRQA
jgi:predicted nuclease of predicted toxin-antitoxin system